MRSYGIYLWHYPVIVLTTATVVAGTNLTRDFFQVAATVIIADLSWRFIETPVRKGALGRLVAKMRSVEWRFDTLPRPNRIALALRARRPAGRHFVLRRGHAVGAVRGAGRSQLVPLPSAGDRHDRAGGDASADDHERPGPGGTIAAAPSAALGAALRAAALRAAALRAAALRARPHRPALLLRPRAQPAEERWRRRSINPFEQHHGAYCRAAENAGRRGGQ